MDYLERIQEAAREFGVENSSSSIVIPVDPFCDEFLIVWGIREDGSKRPEPTGKNAGGDWGAMNIPRYAEGNEVEAELERLELSRDILLALCGASEVWEEVGFFIPPSDLSLMFKLVELHVPDKNALDNVPGTPPHIKVYFGTKRIFLNEPVVDRGEIYDCRKVHISDVEKGNVKVAYWHADAIRRACKVLHSGTIPKAKVICRDEIKDCPVCR